jgi:predicted ribosome quality control (RQC) complex YloA/Tae2 family protein
VHNNYYFLRQLSARLNEKIVGFMVVSCFSQNKDELVIELNNSGKSCFIKANLSSGFCCLSFPENFHRARKNSVDLFSDAILRKVISMRQFENERSFSMELEGQFSLLFKMHGSFANILFLKAEKVLGIFRNNIVTDFEVTPARLDRHIDFSKENFEKNIAQLGSAFFTFGKLFFDYLEHDHFSSLKIEDRWRLFRNAMSLLENPNYYLIERNGKLIFSLLPFERIIEKFTDPIKSINSFSDRYIHDQVFYREKEAALHQLLIRLKSSENYVKKNSIKLDELINDRRYQLWADLIMSNIHTIEAGQDKIFLPNFYDQTNVSINLKKELSPQKNAEIFYRKARNQQIEINKLKDGLTQKQSEITRLKGELERMEGIKDLKTLRKTSVDLGLAKKDLAQFKNLPYHEFEFRGFKILVGRNAEANDKLTLKYSYKEDLWLHAKDVAGSHVLIKYQSGKNFPKDVIEYAAGLAAYNSKRKNESLCPVAFTPKKFVRKRKGDPPGLVALEREDVILVQPSAG